MDKILNEIFYIAFLYAGHIIVGVILILFLDGLFYILFPARIKRFFEKCPITALRITGAAIVLFSILLFLLYLRVIRPLLI